MHSIDILILFSEVSVAIAGFAGIVGAIERPRDAISDIRTQVVVLAALEVLFCSITSLLLLIAMPSENLAWQVASVILFVIMMHFYVTQPGDVKRLLTEGTRIEKLFVGLDSLAAFTLLLNGLALLPWELSTVYLICLFLLLYQAGQYFYFSVERLWNE
jgi:hypothetical protein